VSPPVGLFAGLGFEVGLVGLVFAGFLFDAGLLLVGVLVFEFAPTEAFELEFLAGLFEVTSRVVCAGFFTLAFLLVFFGASEVPSSVSISSTFLSTVAGASEPSGLA
jgi:hypothetical protein